MKAFLQDFIRNFRYKRQNEGISANTTCRAEYFLELVEKLLLVGSTWYTRHHVAEYLAEPGGALNVVMLGTGVQPGPVFKYFFYAVQQFRMILPNQPVLVKALDGQTLKGSSTTEKSGFVLN
jgi:hypothetical protein